MRFSIAGYWGLLRTYLLPSWRRFLLLGGLLVSTIMLHLVQPQLVRIFIDTALAQGPLQTLTTLALLFLGTAVLAQVVAVAEAYIAEHVSVTTTNRLRANLLAHCLRLDADFYSTHLPGELVQRIDGEVSALGNFFSRFVIQLLGNGLLLLAILALSFGIDWRVGVALSAFALLTVLVIDRLRDISVQSWTAAAAADAEMAGFLEERLSGLEDIRANGGPAYVMRQMAEHSWRQLRASRRAMLISVSGANSPIALLALSTAAALGLGGYLHGQGLVTLGEIYLIFAYTELLHQPIARIAREFRDLQAATASIVRTQQLLRTPITISDGTGAALPPAGPLAVAFDHVSFSYGASSTQNQEPRPALEGSTGTRNHKLRHAHQASEAEGGKPHAQFSLRHVTFAVPAGKKLGLLGRTGSGKTTITRLLFRLYDPTEGVVRLGGADVRHLPLAMVRGRIGMVTQDIQLFHASVRDNLTLFDRAIADERIVQVLDELGLQHWYRALPQGLDTPLAPDSAGLSAGEAQLLAFARVFLRDPGVVILDEASSRLDPVTEHEIEQAIERLLEGRTVIIIAHRLSTVQRVDDILILEDGCIGEYGTRSHLAQDPASRLAWLLQIGLEELV